MTTPQAPSNLIEISDVSDEINPTGYVQAEQNIGANTVVRQLTGTLAKSISNTELLLGADLQNKTAFSEIVAISTSNTQAGVGSDSNPITAELILAANSDMYEPTIAWSYVINALSTLDATNSDITLAQLPFSTNNGKNVSLKLSSQSGTKQANLTVTGILTVGNHVVNTATKQIQLIVNAVNTNFQVTGTSTVNATGVVAQTATVALKASANSSLSADTTFVFIPTFVSGTGPLVPIIQSDTIIFTAKADTPLVNSAIYSVVSEMYYQGVKNTSNTTIVDINATYVNKTITSITPSAVVNNNFTNASSISSTIDITAIHDSISPYPQGTITFTLISSGDVVTQSTISSNSTSKIERITLNHDFDADGYGLKKATVDVIATLTNGSSIIDTKKVAGLVLRTGAYGLNITAPSSNSQSGFSAQTASSSGTATWRATAATFSWSSRQFSGLGPVMTEDNRSLASTISIVATAPSGKNASSTRTNTSSYDITGTIFYDGVTVTNTTSSITVTAQSNSYTYTITPQAFSNVQLDVSSGTTSSIIVMGSNSIGSITFTRDNASVGLDTSISGQANIFVTSSGSGSSNNQNVVVTGTLYDSVPRVIESIITQPINIDSTTAELTIDGDSVSKSSDQISDLAQGAYESTSLFGTPSLVFPPTKTSGQDLELAQDSSTRIRIIAAATQSSKTGTYRITGQVVYRGITRTTTKDVTVAITALAPSLTVTKNEFDWNNIETWPSGYDWQMWSNWIANGGPGDNLYIPNVGVDLIAATDFAGTINTDFTITRVDNYIGRLQGVDTVEITGPFYNEAANTSPAPDGFPASTGGKKRRDRLISKPFISSSLGYNITYELRAANGIVLLSNNVTDNTSLVVPTDGKVQLTAGTTGSKYFTFVDKALNGYGYNRPHPSTVSHSQNVVFTASYSGSIPNARYVFNSSGGAIVYANTTTGIANLVGTSTYTDTLNTSFNPTVIKVSPESQIDVQLYSNNTPLGTNAKKNFNFDLPILGGMCFRLATYNSGVRMYSTRDPFGNNTEQIDYSRLPNISTLEGPKVKWLGLHDGSTIYALSNRPLYKNSTRSALRLYSSTGHRAAHGAETPNIIIPTNYFMVMSFSDRDGTNSLGPTIGSIYLIGVDHQIYGPLKLWSVGEGSQNDTSRDSDAFQWAIYEWDGSVVVNYCFISNKLGDTFIPAPPPRPTGSLTLLPTQPGAGKVAIDIGRMSLGSITGGVANEDILASGGDTESSSISGGSYSGFDQLAGLF